ncbi:galectin-3b isoform X2 [Halichoeres trimaculatus]|uniref:galectin-3b isoform X2 n=1 Tax=Halichoeres trimaculatus TaxID=147232 RepID=UPI003D9E6159
MNGNNQWPGAQPNQWPGAQPNQWPGAQPGQWPGAQPSQPSAGQWPQQPGQPSGPGGNSSWPPSQPPSNPSWQPNMPGPGAGPAPTPSFPAAPTPSFPVQPQKKLTIPYHGPLPNGCFDKQLITIAGTVHTNPKKITVDMYAGKDIIFHLCPRFNERVIVRNSMISNKWGKEERDSPRFPFTPGKHFEMKILCTSSGFKVAVDGAHLFEFQHRVRDLRSIQSFNIYEDVTLSKVLVETVPH